MTIFIGNNLTEKSPKVAIIIVNWNRRDDTLECLESLSSINYGNYRIVLVDNGSDDGSIEAVRDEHPEVKIIEAGENLRFAGGNNLGLNAISADDDDFYLLLNNDTTVEPDFLSHLVAAAADSSIGIVGPKILYHDRPDVIWFAGGIIKPAWGYVRHFGLRQPDDGSFDEPRWVSFLTGCCILISKNVIFKVGLLDEGFYLYSEDADYCLRTAKTGFKLVYEPRSRIYHKLSRSSGGAYHPRKWLQRYRSLFRLVRKHTPPVTWPLFCLNLIWELISLPVNALLQTGKLPPKAKN
ncbi:hypothetical protein CEE37_08145 [candidate division LCP-89 bacterium B3_LCP]|uniref:Glycosyltransferase 2-like domain-containing protein n=1 Tax=candidate division LCP-89 bacterium B3_LCP TaxID=2012998 RepID=A0A532UZE0_UNCL8|nr:MAG: hypothetical protein CEE37_08145 [candidate division LCP-89 bacterium B3_LCP]